MLSLPTIAIDNSNIDAIPVIFLHGFGGLPAQWWGVQTAISYNAPTLAFDLPGHGKAVQYPDAGPPKVAAKAVLREMQQRDISKAHFVGHSMGGAIASLMGLIAPEQVASMTLLAPGGFGTEFDHPLLLAWAAARTRDELTAVMPRFFGAGYDLPVKAIDFQLEARAQAGAVETLIGIAKSMSMDGKQGMLPIDEVLAGDYPISVIWGDDDQVLPVGQARALAGKVDLHIVEGMGHSPAEEAPDLVHHVIRKQINSSQQPVAGTVPAA